MVVYTVSKPSVPVGPTEKFWEPETAALLVVGSASLLLATEGGDGRTPVLLPGPAGELLVAPVGFAIEGAAVPELLLGSSPPVVVLSTKAGGAEDGTDAGPVPMAPELGWVGVGDGSPGYTVTVTVTVEAVTVTVTVVEPAGALEVMVE